MYARRTLVKTVDNLVDLQLDERPTSSRCCNSLEQWQVQSVLTNRTSETFISSILSPGMPCTRAISGIQWLLTGYSTWVKYAADMGKGGGGAVRAGGPDRRTPGRVTVDYVLMHGIAVDPRRDLEILVRDLRLQAWNPHSRPASPWRQPLFRRKAFPGIRAYA
jgi:hypothetical protein